MPRIQILPLKNYIHYIKRQVRSSDLNYTSRLDHANILKILHDARVDCFKQFGFSEKNIFSDKLGQLIVADVQAQFLNDGELFEELIIESNFIERERCGFRMSHRIKTLVPFGSLDQVNNNQFYSSSSENNSSNSSNKSTSSTSDGTNKAAGSTFKNIALVEVGVIAISPITNRPIELPEQFFKNIGLTKNYELSTIKK